MLRIIPRASSLVPGRLDADCAVCGASMGECEFVRLNTAGLLQCGYCESWTYLPRPSDQAQAALHDTAEYFEHPYFQSRRNDKSLNFKRCREIFAVVDKVLRIESLRGERLLDVGCDTGSLLIAVSECYGVIPFGLDVSYRAVEASRARGLRVFHGVIDNAPADFTGFKVVTAVDVLEHTARPGVFLRRLYERILPGGILYLQTPNFESVVYRLGRGICNLTGGHPRDAMERLFPVQHVQYFSQNGLRLLAERSGFEVARLETRPLPARDIIASRPVRAALVVLQLIDSYRKQEILHCVVLRKPA